MPININGLTIEQKASVKLLGVHLDSSLSWDEHVNKLLKKLNFGLLLLCKLRSFLTKDQLLMIYRAFIHSHIDYGILAWGLTSQTNLQKGKIIQNKALRIIESLDYLSNVDHLFNNLNIMHVYAMIHYKISYIAWLLIQNPSLVPSVKLKFTSTSYKTRSEVCMKLSSFHFMNNYGKLHFLHMAFVIWNALPLSIRCEVLQSTFKKELKNYIVNLFSDKSKHKLLVTIY